MAIDTLSQDICVPEITPVASLADTNKEEENRNGWKKIQDTLLEWLSAGIPESDNEFRGPSKDAISEALKLSTFMVKDLPIK